GDGVWAAASDTTNTVGAKRPNAAPSRENESTFRRDSFSSISNFLTSAVVARVQAWKTQLDRILLCGTQRQGASIPQPIRGRQGQHPASPLAAQGRPTATRLPHRLTV